MLLSICIPVRDDLKNLRQCLRGLRDQDLSDCEVIVCDDGSNPRLHTSDLPDIAAPVQLLRQVGQGPSVARNHMAQRACGKYLVFIDADTVPSAGMVGRVRQIVSQPGIDAFYGSYDDEPAERSLVSWYRNLLHHYTHHMSARRSESVTTFWCGCGVVRRALYLAVGGLSAFYDKPSIEDIELGGRLTAHGARVHVFPEVQVKHLKHWTLRSWLRTDLYLRGIPWVRLMRANRSWESQLNFSWSQRIASVAAVALVAALPLLAVWPRLAALVLGIALMAFLIPNRRFVALAFRKRGVGAGLAVIPLHVIYALICIASVCLALWAPPLELPPTPKLSSKAEA